MVEAGQTTLFVERELGEALKRTDLPEGFSPQDLHWRWNAFRLVLPLDLFRVKFRMDDPHQEGWDTDIPIVTVAKVLQRQSLDFHPTLFQETQAAFGREPLGDTWPNEGSAQIDIKISFKGRQPNKENAAKPFCRYVSPARALHMKRNVITLRIPSMKWSRYSVTNA